MMIMITNQKMKMMTMTMMTVTMMTMMVRMMGIYPWSVAGRPEGQTMRSLSQTLTLWELRAVKLSAAPPWPGREGVSLSQKKVAGWKALGCRRFGQGEARGLPVAVEQEDTAI